MVKAVNLAVQVYNTSGTKLTQAAPLNQFVGVAPEYKANPDGTVTFGPFLSDPRCYYDPATSRWFMSMLQFAVDPATGAFGSSSLQYIAVSSGADPTGTWNIYSFPTTDDGTDGTPSDPGCPCFGDQPLLGADANGIYITTNEYSISGPAYNGAQLYALSKSRLESGVDTSVVMNQVVYAGGHLWSGLNTAVTTPQGRPWPGSPGS